MNQDISLWLGSESSFFRVFEAHKYAVEHPELANTKPRAGFWDEDDDDDHDDDDDYRFRSKLIEVHGTVGMITINGPLVAEDHWVNDWFGLISYPEISRAAVELAEDASITSILLNMDTGGGDVAGLEGASEALAWARERKPIYTHNGGRMMSAGYWLGAEGQRLSGSGMSDTGSIGVLIVHRSLYKALQEQGIEYTVIRAGKYKALGHPSEELSEEAKAILQGKADELYSFFLEHVSRRRPALSVATKDAWAEGKTFFGEQALQLGLLDEISTLSTRVAALDETDTSDEFDKRFQASNNASQISLEESDMALPKKTVILQSERDKAALAAGAALEDLETVADGDDDQAAAAEAKASGSDTPAPAVEGEEGAAAAEAAETETGEAAKPATDVTAYLQSQNAELNTKVADMRVEMAQLQTERDTMSNQVSELREIATAHLQNMEIALGSTPVDSSDWPISTLLSHHSKVQAKFEEKYKVGRQSQESPVEDTPSDPRSTARQFGIVAKT